MSIFQPEDYERRIDHAIQAALMFTIASEEIRGLINGRFRIDREVDAAVRELHGTLQSLRLPGLELADEPIFEHGRALLPFLRSDDDQRDLPACRTSLVGIRDLVADRSKQLEENAKRQNPLPIEAVLQKGEAPLLRAMTRLAARDGQLAVTDARGRSTPITPPPAEHFATPPMPQMRDINSPITGCKLRNELKNILFLGGLEVECDFDEASIRRFLGSPHTFVGRIRKVGGKWQVDLAADYKIIEGSLQADLAE